MEFMVLAIYLGMFIVYIILLSCYYYLQNCRFPMDNNNDIANLPLGQEDGDEFLVDEVALRQ